jgi:hypothetical protein
MLTDRNGECKALSGEAGVSIKVAPNKFSNQPGERRDRLLARVEVTIER